MILTIDNLDGLGAIDYTASLDATSPLKIERTLNAPSRCSALLALNGVKTPQRRGRIIITADNGAMLFTGYLVTEPSDEYAGYGLMGPLYRMAISAVSDEWLLDKQAVPLFGTGLAQAGGFVLKILTNRVEGTLFTTTDVANGRSVGVFEPDQTQSWSANAAAIAATTYAAYRVVDGALSLIPAGTVTHSLSDSDGTLQIAALKKAAVKELVNDVTVSGAIEPAAHITEVFEGDGSTALFELAQTPFTPASTQNSADLVNDSFTLGVFNPQLWTISDPGAHLGFSAAGLLMTGGNGLDGQTTLAAIDSIEMGGSLVIEAGSLQLANASDGVICGLYQGGIARANCFAGYNVRQSGGSTLVTPFLNGAETGTSYTILTGHRYTLRIRLQCVETQRVLQSFYAMVDGVVESFGGGLVDAPMQIVFELVDLGVSSNTPATVLYDSASAGPIASTPASCTFAAVNSVQLFGSMAYCRITQTSSAWVTSTLPGGERQTRLIGAAGEGVDCTVSAGGRVNFFTGRVPVAGELVTITYRARQRAIARLQNSDSVTQEMIGAASGTAAWRGKVINPPARSTVDCESAAKAIVSIASSRAAAAAGTYEAANPQQTADIWPGDVLALTIADQTASVLVRNVTIIAGTSSPELLIYRLAFANDWADSFSLTISNSVASDALLPQTAQTTAGDVLANLQQLTVVSVSDTEIQIDAGTTPPTGGGFEVRRRDGDFGPAVDQDLILRSPARNFSIPREAQIERYFIRMYDGSNPPLYSRFSSAVFTNVPMA